MTVAIVGGGLAGGAAAVLLARAGRAVQLFEREAGPVDKVCGEFLSAEAQRGLTRLGLDLDLLGASSIARLRLVSGDRSIEAALPFRARGLTRRRLDAALLDVAGDAGAQVHRGVSVRSIGKGSLETGIGSVAIDTIFLASGKHELRGQARDVAGCDTGYVGFKTYWRVPEAVRAQIDGQIEVVLFAGGYAGLQLVEDGIVNLCLLVRKTRLAALGGTWPDLLAVLLAEPHLARRLGDGEPLLPRPVAIAGVPYGFVHRAPAAADPRLFRLGDQAAVIPSFCGDGMAIALHSAAVAAEVAIAGGDAHDHHRRLHTDCARQVRLAMRLQTLGERDWSRRLLWAGLRTMPALATHLAAATRVRAAA